MRFGYNRINGLHLQLCNRRVVELRSAALVTDCSGRNMAKVRYATGINILSDLYRTLDANFKQILEERIVSRGPVSTLLRILKLWDGRDLDILVDVLDAAFERYRVVDERISGCCFCFGQLRLNVTLKDVLYLTGLPIVGEAVVANESRTKKQQKIERNQFFGVEDEKDLKITDLKSYIQDVNQSTDRRIIGTLLLIVECFIAPDTNVHIVSTLYFRFVKELEKVDTYAWGGALLACLYNGMDQVRLGKTSVCGNYWVLTGFLLFHIPRLRDLLNITLDEVPQNIPLTSVLSECLKICHNKRSLRVKAETAFAGLENDNDNAISWAPYAEWPLEDELQVHREYCALASPLFCMDKCVNHAPHLVPRQFPQLFNLGDDLIGIGARLDEI